MQTGTTVQPSKRPATAEDREGAIGATLLWIGVLVVLTVASGLGLMWYRRKVLDRSGEGTQATLMEEFRRMRDSGEITQEEFEATKKAMVARREQISRLRRRMPRSRQSARQSPRCANAT